MENKIKIGIAAIFLLGCYKQKMLEPPAKCQRVYEYSYKYDEDTILYRIDTLWPWGRYNNSFCESDTLQFSNYKPILLGCKPNGFECFGYQIGKTNYLPPKWKK